MEQKFRLSNARTKVYIEGTTLSNSGTRLSNDGTKVYVEGTTLITREQDLAMLEQKFM